MYGWITAFVLVFMWNAAVAQTNCPRDYRPICAQMPDGTKQSFSNRCQARNNKAVIIHDGLCESRCPSVTDTTTALSDNLQSAIGAGLEIQIKRFAVCAAVEAVVSNFLQTTEINTKAIHIGIFTNGSSGGGNSIRVLGGSGVTDISFASKTGNAITVPANTSDSFSEVLTFTALGRIFTAKIVKRSNSNTLEKFQPVTVSKR